MKFKLIASTVLAVGMTTFAVAGDVSTTATPVIKNINVALAVNTPSSIGSAVNQSNKVGSSDTATPNDNMPGFLAVISNVLADNDRSDNLADDLAAKSDNGDDRHHEDPDSRHQKHLERHLGLGFAHGMSNGKGKGPGSPRNDKCRGNGHTGNRNGRGHEDHGNGNGFGHRDCGDPSPSD